jgi:hypothetical protein
VNKTFSAVIGNIPLIDAWFYGWTIYVRRAAVDG